MPEPRSDVTVLMVMGFEDVRPARSSSETAHEAILKELDAWRETHPDAEIVNTSISMSDGPHGLNLAMVIHFQE